ncbi:hypothetical protein BWI17_11175 [Betaproteobacteria bacterium GR16-43]|nr:hypothetical protein BWI17_11175 [Betaproteobacteria bacterium GR16-43]
MQSISELRALLRDPAFPLQWRETTMDDGKPLVMSIIERDGVLFLSLVKTKEGLWAEGASTICVKGTDLEATFAAERMSLGAAAHWAMRYSMANGAEFTLTRVGATRMKIATAGWSAMFSALEPD